jgi:hypothetical protein
MAKYAQNTSVSIERSQAEIQKILRNYGAKRFGTMEDEDKLYLMFEYNNLSIQYDVPLPKKEEFLKTDMGRNRKQNQAQATYEQAIRQRWRAMVIGVKAKLEFINDGISTFEEEFGMKVIMPDGQTLGSHLIPDLKQIAASGKMPKLLNYTKGNE